MQKFQRVPEIKPRGLTGTLVVCSAALLALIMAPSSPSPPAATGGDGEVDVYTLQPWTFLWFAENKSDKRWSCCWTSSHHQCSDWYFTSTLIPLWKSNSRFSSRIFSWLCLCCELMQSWVQGRRRNTEWRLVMKSGSELMIVCSQCSVSAKDTLKRTAAILITRRLCSSVLYEHHVADIEYVCSLQISKVCLLFQWRWWRTYRRHTAVVFTLFHPPYCNQLPTCTTWQHVSLPVLSRVRTSSELRAQIRMK